MALEYIDKHLFNKGVFLFENGKYIYIEEIQYSYDGMFWEDIFNPSEHVDPRDLTRTVPGHRYRRVRHAGDESFQLPEYIVAEDGKTPMFKVLEGIMYMKYTDETDEQWVKIYNLTELKGDKGDKGDNGDGWHIDRTGWYMERPDCTSSLGQVTTTCNTCSGQTSTISSIILFLSLGDGLYTIVNGDVGKYRSDDGNTWVLIGTNDVGDTTRFIADDVNGSNSIDYREEDTLGTRGKVYYCVDGTWDLLFNVAVPRHQMSPTAAYYNTNQTGFFMEDYVGDGIDETIKIFMDAAYKLQITPNSITPKELKDGTFGDGFNEYTGIESIDIKPSDFTGYGLDVYTSTTDNKVNIQVNVDTLIGDGIGITNSTSVDGEDRDVFRIKVEDILNSPNATNTKYTGLTSSIAEGYNEEDGFNNLYVKEGDAIVTNDRGTNVKADELSIVAENLAELAIKVYSAGNDGVLAAHLNPNVANENKGLKVDNSTGLEILLSTDHTAFNFDSTGILLSNEGVQGWHLNSNIADTNKGIKMDTTSDMLEVLLQASGGLRFGSNGIEIDTSDLSWLQSGVVSKVEVWDYKGITNLGDIKGDIAIVGDKNNDTYMDIKLELTGQEIAIKPETNVGNLTSLITSIVNSAGVGAHNHVTADITDLQPKLDAKVDEDVVYGNIKIVPQGGSESVPGLYIQNASGTAWGRLVSIDDQFNLGVR